MCVCIWRHICAPPRTQLPPPPLLHTLCTIPIDRTSLSPSHTRTLDLGLASVCVCVWRVLVIASGCATSLLALAVLCVFEEKKAKEQLISATLTSRRWRHTLLCCCWGEVRARSTKLSVCACVVNKTITHHATCPAN